MADTDKGHDGTTDSEVTPTAESGGDAEETARPDPTTKDGNQPSETPDEQAGGDSADTSD